MYWLLSVAVFGVGLEVKDLKYTSNWYARGIGSTCVYQLPDFTDTTFHAVSPEDIYLIWTVRPWKRHCWVEVEVCQPANHKNNS